MLRHWVSPHPPTPGFHHGFVLLSTRLLLGSSQKVRFHRFPFGLPFQPPKLGYVVFWDPIPNKHGASPFGFPFKTNPTREPLPFVGGFKRKPTAQALGFLYFLGRGGGPQNDKFRPQNASPPRVQAFSGARLSILRGAGGQCGQATGHGGGAARVRKRWVNPQSGLRTSLGGSQPSASLAF